jgi:L-lactate dehydrogenase complex protein LldG
VADTRNKQGSGKARAIYASKERQDEWMQAIADRLGRPRITEMPQHPFRGAPDFWRAYDLQQEERINLFMNNWTNLGGHAFRMSSMEEVGRFLLDFVRETGAQKLLMQRQPELMGLGLAEALHDVECTVWDSSAEEMIDEAAQADIGVVVVDHAAAYTGTIVVLSSPDKGRSTSLLPRALVAVVPASAIEASLGPILKGLDARPKDQLPAGVHFITGPSRSSDIENDLTIGVHGPGIVYALVVG